MDSWEALLVWLESKGFDRNTLRVELREDAGAGGGRKLVASTDIHPRQKLIQIPDKALLNPLTLSSLYPPSLLKALTAIQLLSLHLCLYRHASVPRHDAITETEEKETFIPYIRTLPQDFDTVPLQREVQGDETWKRLYAKQKGISLLPYGLRCKVDDVSRRYKEDLRQTRAALCEHKKLRLPGIPDSEELPEEDYVWAWLCVNSRCIYQDLGLPDHKDNITMSPIIDGNHASGRKEEIVYGLTQLALSSGTTSQSGVDLFTDDHSSVLTKAGDEVLYSYGAHGDDTLLAEYGFTLGQPANTDHSLDVTQLVEDIYAQECGDEELAMKNDILQSHGYYGDYHITLDSEGQPDVSFRLTVALALLSMKLAPAETTSKRPCKRTKRPRAEVDASHRASNEATEGSLIPFLNIVNGVEDPDEVIQERINVHVSGLCNRLSSEAEGALSALYDFEQEDTLVAMVRSVWTSQATLATRLKDAIGNGTAT